MASNGDQRLNQSLAAVLASFAFTSIAAGQTSLSAGDLSIVGLTSDTEDSFSLVIWKSISANTTIRFMDHSFTNTSTSVNGTEDDFAITFTTGVSAGTLIRYVNNPQTVTANGSALSVSFSGDPAIGLNDAGDQVFAYQGSAVGTSGTSFSGRTALFGFNIAGSSWITTGTATANDSYLPNALNAPDLNYDSGNFDNSDYVRARSGLTASVYRAAVVNVDNRNENNTRFDLATTGFSVTSSADLYWDANGTGAGTGGTGTWNTTTQSRFKNVSTDVTPTFIPWVNAAADNSHTAVFGGTAGTVTVSSVTASGLRFSTNGYTLNSGTITTEGSTVFIEAVSGVTATINSAIAGSADVNITDPGSVILGGTNTYSGETLVDGGATLRVTGSLSASSAAVTIDNTSRLEGTGTISRPVTIADGATLAPGAGAAGTLTVQSTLALNSTSVLSYELSYVGSEGLDQSTTTTNDDRIVGLTGLTLDGTINVAGIAGDFATAPIGASWTIMTLTSGSITDNSLTLGTMPTLAAGRSWIRVVGSGLVQLQLVPEPIAAGAAMLLAGRILLRRRQIV
jgi:autotransporter-associated beta strand protein